MCAMTKLVSEHFDFFFPTLALALLYLNYNFDIQNKCFRGCTVYAAIERWPDFTGQGMAAIATKMQVAA